MTKFLKFACIAWLLYVAAFIVYFVLTGEPLVIAKSISEGIQFLQITLGAALTVMCGAYLGYQSEVGQ